MLFAVRDIAQKLIDECGKVIESFIEMDPEINFSFSVDCLSTSTKLLSEAVAPSDHEVTLKNGAFIQSLDC